MCARRAGRGNAADPPRRAALSARSCGRAGRGGGSRYERTARGPAGSMTGRDRVRGEQAAPLPVGSSMPPELAGEMARAGELLDLGDRVGARRIVRRVLDRAAPELLGELADLATDLGWARRTAPPQRGGAPRCSPGAAARSAVRVRPVPAPGLTRPAGARGTWPTPAGRRGRDGGGEVASYLATRGGVDDAPEPRRARPRLHHRLRPRRPGGLRAAVCLGCHLERTPADVGRGDGVCADCRADGLGRNPIVLRCEAILAPRCAAARGPAASCGGCGRRRRRRPGDGHRLGRRPRRAHPAGPARPLTRRLRAPGPVTRGDRAAPRCGAAGGDAARPPTAHRPRAGALGARRYAGACPSSPAHRSRPADTISDPAVTTR